MIGGREGGDALRDFLEVQLAPRRGDDDGLRAARSPAWRLLAQGRETGYRRREDGRRQRRVL